MIFLAAIFYIHSIHTTYMISDEYLVYRFTRGSLNETVDYLAKRDVHPPLWFSFFWGWRRLTGDSDFSGRMQAILFSLMTLCIIYQMGWRWFGAWRYGLFSLVILGVSALFFRYSLEIRPYAFAMFLVSLSMFAFQYWLKRRSTRSAVVYAVTLASLMYVHYFLFLFILMQVIYFVFQRPVRQLWRQAVLVVILSFALWSPWFPSFLSQLERIRSVELAAGAARGVAGSSATTQSTSVESIVGLIQLATNGQIVLYAVVLTIGVIYSWRKVNYRLALAWAIGVPAVAFALNTIVAVYTPRYIVNFVIGLALVLAVGLAILPRYLRWIGLTIFVAVSLWALPSQLPTDIVPYQVLLNNLISSVKPGDVIFFDEGGYNGDVMKWVWRNNTSLELRETVTLQVEEALKARRVWDVTGDWFNEAVRANYKLIEESHPRQSGFGQCDVHWCYLIQLMEAPPWTEPMVFGGDMAFWGADVDAITPETIKTRLWWKVEQTPTLDYSMSLRLVDSSGSLVAQADGPINHYGAEVVNTSQLEPNRIYIDFRTLNLASSLPPGNYLLELVVYDWKTNIRLLLADGSNRLTLQGIDIPAH